MNSNDYLMRQIEDIMQVIAKSFFHKTPQEVPLFDSQGNPLESGYLYVTITALVQQGKINEAENLLFKRVEADPSEENLIVAIRFYAQLNTLSQQALENANFTRQEIVDGLNEVKAICEE